MRLRLAVATMLALFARDTAACSCAHTTLEEKLDGAEVVALVRIENARVNPEWIAELGKEEPSFRVRPILATFEPVEVFKGTLKQVKYLTSGYGGGDCGLPLIPGSDVLVSGTSDGQTLSFGYCSASRPLHPYSIGEASKKPWRRRSSIDAAYIEAVRAYLAARVPIHECVTYRDVPWEMSKEEEQKRDQCREYLDQFEVER